MELAPQPVLKAKLASVEDAKLCYFAGDFERCLEICENIPVRTLGTASEIALLTSRAYLRLGRPHEAETTLAQALGTHTTLDASLTAQMLVANARIRQNDADSGIAMLEKTAAAAALGAHFAIRSEIAFSTALGYWAKRDITAAKQYLALVDPRSDIIHARALELHAWCHSALREYRRSAEYFQLALLRLDDCEASDRAISATAISTLAIFAAELFDRDIARFVESRAQRIDWLPALKPHHFTTLLHQALFHEFAGNTIEAYQFVAQAREIAPTVGFEVLGWGTSSAIARNAGEVYSATVFGKRGQRLLETLNGRELHGEERASMLSIVECSVHFSPDSAAELFARYAAAGPLDSMCPLSNDPRVAADEAFIAGVLAQSRGECDRAQMLYRKAFETFKEIGYARRALTTAHAILELGADEALRRYISAQLAGTANYIAKSLDRRDDDVFPAIDKNSIVASLPPAQQAVVNLICQGKTNKEIAQLRHVGEQTIKNMLTKNVFPAFGVSSRAGLVSVCLRGG